MYFQLQNWFSLVFNACLALTLLQVADASDAPGRDKIIITAGWDYMVLAAHLCALSVTNCNT